MSFGHGLLLLARRRVRFDVLLARRRVRFEVLLARRRARFDTRLVLALLCAACTIDSGGRGPAENVEQDDPISSQDDAGEATDAGVSFLDGGQALVDAGPSAAADGAVGTEPDPRDVLLGTYAGKR